MPAPKITAAEMVAVIQNEIDTRTSHFGEPLNDEQVEARRRFELSYWQHMVGVEEGVA